MGKTLRIVTIGPDLAKNLFAKHGVDATGQPGLARRNMPAPTGTPPPIGLCSQTRRLNRSAISGVHPVWQRWAKGLHMLSNASVTTMLPVIDMARARAFYEGSLGLEPGGLKPDGKFVYVVGGSTLALFPKPEGTKADHTAISFQVPDIAASIAALKGKGVVFENYDFPGLKTVDHVCVLGAEKAAWFKDPEGNYLCLHEDLA